MPTEPTDDDLRDFVLGTLPADRAPDVQRWLDADPARAARLDRLAARDPLTEAVASGAARAPVRSDSVERVARGVAEALRAAPDADTASEAESGGTVVQPRPPVPEVPAWPPARLGQFRVVRELGHGGMGYVFEAEDELIGRRVAVKVLTPELARRPDAAARFLREARAAAKVEHENVVPVLHVGDDGGVPYIVMPLLRGESLADRIKREKKLSTEEVIRIGRDVAAGLGAAHGQGLVHRDMKPANVWLDTDGRARVLDFGLARLTDGADALTDSRALMGTPAYMAPEQLDGRPATPQSDLFGLGAVLYECATGTKAFDGPSITAILNAVNACRPKPLAELNPEAPPSLAALVERLLKKNPTERPAEAREVIAALVLRQGDAGSDLSTAPWIDPERRVRPRSRKAVWLVGGLALAALVAVGVYFGTRPRQPETVQEPPKGNTEPTTPAPKPDPKAPTRYTGKVDVLVERVVEGKPKLLRLDQDGALPLSANDRFRIEGEVKPPAYLYLVWVDPDRDVTPAYPWNPEADRWQGTRPAVEEMTGKVSLPRNTGDCWRAPNAKPGVATMVLFARPTPLDVADEAVEKWFKDLPDLPLPPGGDGAAVWFDNYAVVTTDPARRAGFVREASNDPFARWQGQLQKSIGEKAAFQTAVSFARTGRK